MSSSWRQTFGEWRVLLAGILVILAAGLGIAGWQLAPHHAGSGRDVSHVGDARRAIDAAVDSTLARYHVDLHKIRTRDAWKAGTTLVRRESVIEVPPGFVSLLCNRDLQEALLPLGGQVIASEHTRDQTVVMHIRKDGIVIRTIVFLERPGSDPTVGTVRTTSHDH